MRTAARRGGGWSGAEEDIRRRPRGRFAMDASEPVVRVLVCGMCTLKALSARGLQDAERWGAGKGPGEEWRGGAPPAGRGAGGPGRTGEWSAARRGGAAPHGPGRGQQPWDAPVGPPPGFPAKARTAPAASRAARPSAELPLQSQAPGHPRPGCTVPAGPASSPACCVLHRPFPDLRQEPALGMLWGHADGPAPRADGRDQQGAAQPAAGRRGRLGQASAGRARAAGRGGAAARRRAARPRPRRRLARGQGEGRRGPGAAAARVAGGRAARRGRVRGQARRAGVVRRAPARPRARSRPRRMARRPRPRAAARRWRRCSSTRGRAGWRHAGACAASCCCPAAGQPGRGSGKPAPPAAVARRAPRGRQDLLSVLRLTRPAARAQHRGGGGVPEWAASEDAGGMSGAERQRAAFEAERQKLADARRRAADARDARMDAGGPRERAAQGTSAARARRSPAPPCALSGTACAGRGRERPGCMESCTRCQRPPEPRCNVGLA